MLLIVPDGLNRDIVLKIHVAIGWPQIVPSLVPLTIIPAVYTGLDRDIVLKLMSLS